MRRLFLALSATLFLIVPAFADDVEAAFEAAIVLFETARPHLGTSEFGVDIVAYRDALTLRRFSSAHWGSTVRLDIAWQADNSGACRNYAAFIHIPPRDGVVTLGICPQFLNSGTGELRRLTVLHELVHAVAGPDECRAMAFAARIEQLAMGRFTRVDNYWQANDGAQSAFRLP